MVTQVGGTPVLVRDLGRTTLSHQERQRLLGTANDLDVLAQQSLEAQTAQTLPLLQKQLGQSRDALTALLGRLPSEEPQDTFRLDDLTLPTDVPVSLPSQLVSQRPDVRLAEDNLHATSASVGVAIANLLPQFPSTPISARRPWHSGSYSRPVPNSGI